MTAGRDARITFAIPFYENATYLLAALESVRRQSRRDWNAVVVDDSLDGTQAKGAVDSLNDPRISYVRNTGTHGIGQAWNCCLDVARTELVTILHADDELLPEYAELMVKAADRDPKPVAFFCGVTLVDEGGAPIRSAPDLFKRVLMPRPDAAAGAVILEGEPAARRLLQGNFIVAPTVCYRRERLNPLRFSRTWRFVLDLDLYLRLLMRGDTLMGLPQVALRWRRHGEATTARLTRTLERFREESEFLDGMVGPVSQMGWENAAAAARRKTVRKLHLVYLAAADAVRLRPRDASAKLSLLARFERSSRR